MTILKALKNFITKSGGTTKAGTIAEAINDMPVGGGYRKYELKRSSDTSGTFVYIDGLTYEEFKETFENRDQAVIVNDEYDNAYNFSWMIQIICDDQNGDYSMIFGDSSASIEFAYDQRDGLFKNYNMPNENQDN